MKRDRIIRALLVVSFGYWLLVLGAGIANVLLVPAFEPVAPLSRGCYQTDALLIYVECVGFFGAKSIGFLLTLPWLILQMPWLVFNPIGLPFALLLWAPVVFPLVYWVRRARAT